MSCGTGADPDHRSNVAFGTSLRYYEGICPPSAPVTYSLVGSYRQPTSAEPIDGSPECHPS